MSTFMVKVSAMRMMKAAVLIVITITVTEIVRKLCVRVYVYLFVCLYVFVVVRLFMCLFVCSCVYVRALCVSRFSQIRFPYFFILKFPF